MQTMLMGNKKESQYYRKGGGVSWRPPKRRDELLTVDQEFTTLLHSRGQRPKEGETGSPRKGVEIIVVY